MSKRISFDRPTHVEVPLVPALVEELIIRDPERMLDGWERVYTVVSVMYTFKPTQVRFGTGGEDRPKWHEDDNVTAANIYINTEREYHCREHDRGVIGLWDVSGGTAITVNWHGYDKLIGER